MLGTMNVKMQQEDEVAADAGHHPPSLRAEHGVMPAGDDEEEPDQAEDRAGGAGREGGRVDEDGEHAAAGRTEQVDQGVLDRAVHALDDRAVQVQDVHVEGDVDRPEMEEGAREDPPPLPGGDERAIDEVLLSERPDPARERARPS